MGEGRGAGSEPPRDTLQENEIARTANGLELNKRKCTLRKEARATGRNEGII